MGLAARFALAVVSTAAYLGLAILGWGGASFFSNPARIVLALVALAMGLVAMFAGGNLSPGVREDRGNRWVIAAFGVIGLLDGFLPAYTDRIDFWTIDGDAIRWSGVAIFAAGGVLRLWPVFVLGRRFSGLVAIQRPYARDNRHLSRHSPSELSRSVTHRARLGLGFSFGCRPLAFGTSDAAPL